MASLGELTGRVLADIDAKVDGFAEESFRALTDPMSVEPKHCYGLGGGNRLQHTPAIPSIRLYMGFAG